MHKTLEELHHHGKKLKPVIAGMYKHAKKHHKKYLWGAMGFFGLFKLFSFLLLSLGYIITYTNTTQASTPLIIQEDTFEFFIGNAKCDKEITETTETQIYPCVNFISGSAGTVTTIQNMKFSFTGKDDLTNQEWIVFSNSYPINIPEGSLGKIILYAQYGYNKDNLVSKPVTDDIQVILPTKGTPFTIGRDSFEFFIGDPTCTNTITETTGTEIYLCTTTISGSTIGVMRFSFKGIDDIKTRSWIGFSNGYALPLSKTVSGTIVFYAQYGYNGDIYSEPITGEIYKIPPIGMDPFDFFIGDNICNPVSTIDTTNQAYLCIAGSNIGKTTVMRYSTSSIDDLSRQEWTGYSNPYPLTVNDGITNIYVEYGYDTGNSTIKTGSAYAYTTIQGSANIAGQTINSGESLDTTNIYRIIKSTENNNQVSLNSAGIASTITVGLGTWDGNIIPPTVMSDDRTARQGEQGLPEDFIPSDTVLVGANGVSLTLDNNVKFNVSFQVTDQEILPGTTLPIYYSYDGNSWSLLETDCTVDGSNMCTFSSSHLTLFSIGRTGTNVAIRNNMDFINQRFRDTGPTTGQIIYALFGSGSSRSAYTTHWNTTCTPTTITTLNPGTRGATNLSGNTIYILNSGNYIATGAMTLNGNCIAIVGSGIVNVNKIFSASILVYATAKTNIIIDNIQLDGNGYTHINGGGMLAFSTAGSVTINDIQAYNISGIAIAIGNGSGFLINNTQIFNNKGIGLNASSVNGITINNIQSYNNVQGIYSSANTGMIINNSQIYNNAGYGFGAVNSKQLTINNTQIYNNNGYGISLTTSTNGVNINSSKIFNNAATQVYADGTSSGWYYGNNIAYPNAGFTNFSAGLSSLSLGWVGGSVSTTNLGFSCEFVTTPINGLGIGMYPYGTCNDIGHMAWTGTAVVKYSYGNNMELGNYVTRQIRPVIRLPAGLSPSQIPYHGHRFMGEYDDPSGRDLNVPIGFFTGETPIAGYNVNATGYFSVRSYIYEPNLSGVTWNENINNTNINYPIYDNNTILMMNFDKVAQIGDSTGIAIDLSIYKNHGTINGATTRTGNGKRNGAYNFTTAGDRISVGDTTSLRLDSGFTLAARVKRNTTNTAHQIFFYDNCLGSHTTAYGVDIDTNNKLRMVFQDATTNYITTNTTSIGTSWTHIAVTHTNNYTYFYINGVLDTGVYQPYNPYYGSTVGSVGCDGLAIGQYNDGSYAASQLTGLIDEVRIYNKAISSGDIALMYRSNLSSKSDHREYVVNYTGIGGRGYGVQTFGFQGSQIADTNNNVNNSITSYVNNYLNCTGSLIGWNNDNFINSGFWNNNPGYCDIVIALFGTGTSGNDTTAYTSNRSGRNNSNICNYQNMGITYLTGGTDKLPSILSAYMIYVLASGTYIETHSVKMNICSAIIGQTGGVRVYSTIELSPGTIITDSDRSKTILDNFSIFGTDDGNGGSHVANSESILNRGSRRTNNAIKSFDSYVGIHNENTNFNSINNISTSGGDIGIYLFSDNHSTITDSQTYNAAKQGISIDGASNNTTINNIQSYNNGSNGINIQIDGEYITINNSQLYNNGGNGITIDSAAYYSTINNTHVFNNLGNGIHFGSSTNSGILNNVRVYNNAQIGIYIFGGNHKYYGKLTVFANSNTIIGGLTAGVAATYAGLGWTGGTLDTAQCMNCSRVTNPINTSYLGLINTTIYPKCDMKGNTTAWASSENINYTYGVSLTGQKIPVRYPNTTLTNSSLSYNGTKYVAEVNSTTPDYTTTQCSCSGHTYRWNNNNFLDDSFWNHTSPTPDYCDIIAALYGTGTTGQDRTAYSNNRGSQWTGQCNVENIEVKYLTGGTGKIDDLMNDHTLYVLASGNYIQTGTTYTNWCNGILGKTGNIMLYSTMYLSNGMFSNVSTRYTIFDKLSINGTGGGIVPNHNKNQHGIYFNTAQNNTINNIQSYNNERYGIYLGGSLNNIINNTKTYNNLYGIVLDGNSNNNIVTNTQSYENGQYGIVIGENGYYNVLNNIQTYNNNNEGILVVLSSDNTLNNIQTYNNGYDGIYIDNSPNTLFNNIQSYNNGSYGIYIDSATNNKYYGTGKIFNNGIGNIFGLGGGLVTGYANDSEIIGLGWTTGTITETSTMSRDYITNPTDIIGNYLVPRTGARTGIIGQQTSYINTLTNKYSYGSGILLQTQPVYYSGTTLKTGGIFSGTNYIGSLVAKYTGSLIGLPATTATQGPFTVTGSSSNGLIGKYILFGDIITPARNNINTPVTISLSAGDGTKRIVTQLYDNAYFATHFQTTSILNSTMNCASRWNNDNFITGAFWTNGTPTNENIICALYGTGPGDTTAYTQLWSGWDTTQCSGIQMNVVYTGNLGLANLVSNTIYVVTGQISTGAATINIATCSAIISNNNIDTTFYSTNYVSNGMFYGTAKKYVILDNIGINGSDNGAGGSHGKNYYGIQAIGNTNNSFNRIKTYNNSIGILMNNNQYNTINNSQFYNNIEGIEMIIASKNIINNSQFYNNSVGISGMINQHNTINNSQFYNNNYGIYMVSWQNDSINNSRFYNNGSGGIKLVSSPDININNSWIYNNTLGIDIDSASTSGRYFGNTTLFNNLGGNIIGTTTNFITGIFNGIGRSPGTLTTTGNMSRDYITNPINTINNYLVLWTGSRTGIIGTMNYTGTTNKYSYGSGISLQTQSVYYIGTTLTTGGNFDTTKYIGSSITRYTGALSGLPSTTTTTGVFVVTGLANASWINNYSIFGDVFAYKIGQTINTSTGIYLLSGEGTKRIITQIYSGSDFATHFQTTTTLDTTIHCASRWNNDNFITGAFRTGNGTPTDQNIICALYGTGPGDTTAYTQFWSGWNTTQCSGIQMNVVYTGNLGLANLVSNTIYVMTGKSSIGSGNLGLTNCSTIISNQNTGTTIYASTYNTSMISGSNSKQNIFDNINIDGKGNGVGGYHTGCINGISLRGAQMNITINNIDIYNIVNRGIQIYLVSNLMINNSRIYNSAYGVFEHYSSNNNINNTKIFNNTQVGIVLNSYSNNNSINNTQVFNNGVDGIQINTSKNNTINNSQFYNNSSAGIEFLLTSSGNSINNSQIYNNTKGIEIDSSSNNNKYYGNILVFNNIISNIGGTPVNFITGTLINDIGRIPGTLTTTGIMSRDYITNPINTIGNYLIPWTGSWTGMISQQSNYTNTGSITDKYSYGSGILAQAQPVYYSGTTLTTGGIFDTTKYIGSSTTRYTGALSGIPSSTMTTGIFMVTGLANATWISKYSLFGDVFAYKIGQTINTSTGIYLLSGEGTKRIITQIYSGSDFATHFQTTTTLDTTIHCASRWNNDNFITGAFWTNGTPTDENIICALYGTGTSDKTAYTQIWSGRNTTQCSGIQMNVVYTGIVPEYFSNNTIYVINSGTYNISTSRNIASCSALISSGNVVIQKNTTINGIFATGITNFIMENININGNNFNLAGIKMDFCSNNTLNNIQVYKQKAVSGGYPNAIHIEYTGNNNSVSNSKIYNNDGYGILISELSHNNTILNNDVYNNNYGITITISSRNSINNNQVHNNSNLGIEMNQNATNNILNNNHVYSNGGNGIEFTSNSSGNILNNIRSYNNNAFGKYGIYTDASSINNKYYGTGKIFNNRNGIGAGLSTGYANDINIAGLGWSTGILIKTGIDMTRDYITNPISINNNYLVLWTGLWTEIIGQKADYMTTVTEKYSYGSGISLQTQPVYYSGTTLKTGGLFDSTKYIGSSIARYTGSLSGINTIIVVTGGFNVTGLANATQISNYSLFGDIFAYKIGQTINTSTGIYLLSGDGTKRIVTQIFSGLDFATHFQTTTILDTSIDCASRWNNDNFITGAFWTNGTPTDENIICALYGTGTSDKTAYTQIWSGRNTTQCSGIQMNVVYTGNLQLSNLLPNTIYVATGSISTGSTTIEMEQCSAIVSNQSPGTIFISDTRLSTNPMISINSREYAVIDNIRVNGYVLNSTSNQYGIRIDNLSNATLNNIDVYNMKDGTYYYGILGTYSSPLLNNIRAYNNQNGIGTLYTERIKINNSQIYNNNSNGLSMAFSTKSTINNVQTYNNNGNGIWIHQLQETMINNMQTYNNNGNGLSSINSSGTILNNTRAYNNNNIGIDIDAQSSNTRYYGDIKTFNNGSRNLNGSMFAGSSSDYPLLGRSNGSTSTGTMSFNWITNPINTIGNYLITWTGSWTDSIGQQENYTGTITDKYSYGSGISLQAQPVYYSGTTLTTGGTFDTTKYIGSSITRYTGSLIGINTTSYTTGLLTVTGSANTTWINKYSLFGDIFAYKIGQNINTSTGIYLLSGDDTKRIVTQIYSGSDFATHFQTTTTLDTSIDCASRWNNNNFITGAFWTGNGTPTDQNIICALYGTGPSDTTAYTQLWSGWNTTQCSGIQMNVVYTGKLSITGLIANTIYVVTGQISTGAATINMANCSVIISNQSTGTTFYSTTGVYSSMLYAADKQHIIFDNITINGQENGAGGIHLKNAYGIQVTASTNQACNTTINNTKTNNNDVGIISWPSCRYLTINNTESYNNTYHGIYLGVTNKNSNNTLNNIQAYNNGLYGIYIYRGSENTINNSQLYNNGSGGIYISNISNNNSINNTQSYNNGVGLKIDYSTGTNINNSQFYNNTYGISLDTTSTNTRYFGNTTLFNNLGGNITGTTTNFITGTLINAIGRIAGTLTTTGNMSRDYITNPINTTSKYLVPWTGSRTGIIGTMNYTGMTNKYSYGSGILVQAQSVYYSETTLTTGGVFDTIKYIGSSITRYTGSLSGLPNPTTTTGVFVVTGLANQTIISNYSLFGDIFAYKIGQTINTSTGIYLLSGEGTKRIVTQIYSGSDFATHFQTTTNLNTTIDCASRWNNDNFITGAFWTSNGTPTDENIICALYGTGPGDTTAYTQIWSGWNTTQCSGVQINVVYTGNLNLITGAENTIYVMTGQISTGATTINMATCSTVISNQSTGTTFYSSTGLLYGGMFYINNKQYSIFDNISINGTGGGPVPSHTQNAHGIYYSQGKNNTINNSQIYKSLGAIGFINSDNNSINNSKLYNNSDLGVNIQGGNNNFLNNNQIYNQIFGIEIQLQSNNNTINNCQFYNNKQTGIYIYDSLNNSINNSQIYNNGTNGIYLTLTGSNNSINNSQIYNNLIGIYIDASSTNNKYYGNIIVFNNALGNITGTTANFITGTLINAIGRIPGTLTTTGNMSRDYITNPINTLGNYLAPRTGTWTNIRGRTNYTGTTTDKYSYGSGILLQAQPVYYSGGNLQTGGTFDTTKYIGSSTTRYTGALIGITTTSYTTGVFTVTGSANTTWISKYSLFGDIFAYKIGQTINTSTGIYLLSGEGTKRIVTQIYSGSDFATHFQTTTTIDTVCTLLFTGTTPPSGTTLTGNNFKPQIQISGCRVGIDTFNYTVNSTTYPYYDSGLILMMNFDNVSALGETAGTIKDFSWYGNNGSGYGGTTWTSSGKWNGAYIFNGSNSYISGNNLGLSGNATFTISYWMKRDSAVRDGNYPSVIGNSTTAINRGLSTTRQNGRPALDFRDSRYRATNPLQTGQRYFVTFTKTPGLISTTSKIYINGQLVAGAVENTDTTPDILDSALTIGRLDATRRFSGTIDEVRIRNRALTSGQILQMWRSNLAKYDTGMWLFTDDKQCVVSNTYIYTGYVLSTAQVSATTGRTTIVNIAGRNPIAPIGYFLGITGAGTTIKTLSGQFTGYFQIEDWKGNSGRYTTLQTPLRFTGIVSNAYVDYNNIYIMATGVDTIGNTTIATSSIYVTGSLGVYQTGTLPKTYIVRGYDANQYSCPTGIYGNKPYIRVDVPAYQTIDTYSGQAEIFLYE